MVAGDKNVALEISAGGFNMTGYTVTLLAAPGQIVPGTGRTLSPLTISDDGLTATYLTTGTDFQQGGPWQLQLACVQGQNLFTSPPGTLFIYPRL